MSLNALFAHLGNNARAEMMAQIAASGILPDSKAWMARIMALPAKECGRAWYRSGPFAFRRVSAGRWQWRVGVYDVEQEGEAATFDALVEQIERACGRKEAA
jgi:hypothetical protein